MRQQSHLKHNKFMVHLIQVDPLALNAKPSVDSNLAPNLQMCSMSSKICKKLVQEKCVTMINLVELGGMTILCSPKSGIIINVQNQVPK